MKKSILIVCGILLLISLAISSGIRAYNSIVTGEEKVTSAWAEVENQYDRRANLIPNLVSTVKGYASHESETLQAVVEARANATSVKVDPKNMTPEKLAEFSDAQGAVGSALGRLLMVRENYPDLKADAHFADLMTQLEGTENRITVARQRFNEEARLYNTDIRRFPRSIIASLFGFDQKPYFKAAEGTETAPVVEF